MTYIWVEDSDTKGLYKIIDFVLSNRKNKVTEKYALSTFDGFGNISRKIKKWLSEEHEQDVLIIFLDYVIDNQRVYEKYLEVQDTIQGIDNIFLSKLICFEFLLLQFRYIKQWAKPMSGKLDSYNKGISVRDELLNNLRKREYWGDNELIYNYIVDYYNKNISNKFVDKSGRLVVEKRLDGVICGSISLENVSNIILREITKASVFKTDKNNLSSCWITACYSRGKHKTCKKGEWGMRVCSITENRLTAKDKADIIYSGTYLCKIFDKVFKYNRRRLNYKHNRTV